MDIPQLPPGWQIFRNQNGQVIYANVLTGEFQDIPPASAPPLEDYFGMQSSAHPPVAAAALALPPGWTQMTNASGRTEYKNESLGRMQYDFPLAEAERAQAPSAPPVDPRTEQVKTQYYPHVDPFSRIPPEDIIDMLYHPLSPPELTPDDIDLIINNYVGTAINHRRMICKDDVDILSCAKKLFRNNASNAQHEYSFQLPIQPAAVYKCDGVAFRWNPDNESKKSLGDNPTAFLTSRLFPLNDNTARWLCSTHTNPIPTMSEAVESRFMLDFFDAKEFRMSPGKTPIQFATETRDRMSTPEYREQQKRWAEQEKQRQKEQAERSRQYAEQQRILDAQHRAEQAKKDAERKRAFEDHMGQWRGGLKGRRKQTKLKQTKRKEVKRKQTKRRS